MSKIAVRGGHTELCPGASAIIDELTEDRKVKDSVIKYLRQLGAEVLDCTPPVNYTSSVSEDLAYGVNKANNWGAELFVSIHFNKAYDAYNGALGSEVCVYSQFEIAQRVGNAMAELGFKNRGQKIRTGLYELKHTNMKSMIVETCFVEATEDVGLYRKLGFDKIGKTIAEAILNQKIVNEVEPKISVIYQAHIEDIGWQSERKNGETAGTVGQSKRLEALTIRLSDKDLNSKMKIQAHIQNIGDDIIVSGGHVIGNVGEELRIESIKIDSPVALQYRVHQQDIGWTSWVDSGNWCGVKGQSKRVEAIEIKIK